VSSLGLSLLGGRDAATLRSNPVTHDLVLSATRSIPQFACEAPPAGPDRCHGGPKTGRLLARVRAAIASANAGSRRLSSSRIHSTAYTFAWLVTAPSPTRQRFKKLPVAELDPGNGTGGLIGS
jgi:hypothetical protein